MESYRSTIHDEMNLSPVRNSPRRSPYSVVDSPGGRRAQESLSPFIPSRYLSPESLKAYYKLQRLKFMYTEKDPLGTTSSLFSDARMDNLNNHYSIRDNLLTEIEQLVERYGAASKEETVTNIVAELKRVLQAHQQKTKDDSTQLLQELKGLISKFDAKEEPEDHIRKLHMSPEKVPTNESQLHRQEDDEKAEVSEGEVPLQHEEEDPVDQQ